MCPWSPRLVRETRRAICIVSRDPLVRGLSAHSEVLAQLSPGERPSITLGFGVDKARYKAAMPRSPFKYSPINSIRSFVHPRQHVLGLARVAGGWFDLRDDAAADSHEEHVLATS